VFVVVTIIPENERKLMTYDEVKSIFDGKWVFLTHAIIAPGTFPEKGVPTVIADKPFEGVESSLYDEFDKDEYGQTISTDLRPFDGMHVASPLYEI